MASANGRCEELSRITKAIHFIFERRIRELEGTRTFNLKRRSIMISPLADALQLDAKREGNRQIGFVVGRCIFDGAR